MIAFRQILHPTDFSEQAAQALDHALFLARQHDATLHVLHIAEVSDRYFDEDDDLRARLTDRMGDYLDGHDPAGIPLQTIIDAGETAGPGIRDYARTQGIDLVVIGTHGRKGLRRMFVGSVAEAVVREAPCPVLAVRRHQRPFPEHPVDAVLAPLDLSEHGGAALPHALDLAARFDARLDVLYVFDNVDLPGIYGDIANPVPEVFPEVKAKAADALREAVAAAGGEAGLHVAYHVRRGEPAEVIAEFAEECGSDYVALATHGRSGLSEALIGSTTEQVMRAAPCPVFVVPSFTIQG